MNMVTVDGKEYDLDTLSPEARAQVEQLLFFASDVAKLMMPAGQLQAKVDSSKKALAQALAASKGDVVKPG